MADRPAKPAPIDEIEERTPVSRPAPLSEALEDYLEIILELSAHGRTVRVRDIARAKAVRMPTVTWALRTLAARKLVVHRARQVVELTPAGAGVEVAQHVAGRHALIGRFLTEILGVSSDAAGRDACRLEHHLSGVTLERLAAFVEYVQTCPIVGADFLHRFQVHFGAGPPGDEACPDAPAGFDCPPGSLGACGERDLVALCDLDAGTSCRIVRLAAERRTRLALLRLGLVPGRGIRLQGRELVLSRERSSKVYVRASEGGVEA